MDENKVRQALAYVKTFRKIAYPYIHTPPNKRRQSQHDALYMCSLQLSAALAQLLGRDNEETLS